MKTTTRRMAKLLTAVVVLAVAGTPALGDDSAKPTALDHYVHVKSAAPGMAGQDAQIYVREVVLPSTALRGGPGANRVVLFVHGAGTPAECSNYIRNSGYAAT